MKNKLSNKLLTIGMLFALAAGIFSGCLSTGGGTPLGTLTVTGIPAEYVGKFIKADVLSIEKGEHTASSGGDVSNRHTAITNREIKLPLLPPSLLGRAYVGDTSDVFLEITDKELGPNIVTRAVFASVAFNGGVGEVNWGDALKPIYITVTNIPEIYNKDSSVQAGQRATKMPVSIGGITAFGFDSAAAATIRDYSGWVEDGTTTVPILPSRRESGNYMPFPERGTIDIVVNLRPSTNSAVSVPHQFLFTAAPITNSRVVVDFRRGIRQ